ncbi:MAG: hypothetical protein ACR2OM_16050, partial [Aestuariivirgaceae bacterium]
TTAAEPIKIDLMNTPPVWHSPLYRATGPLRHGCPNPACAQFNYLDGKHRPSAPVVDARAALLSFWLL